MKIVKFILIFATFFIHNSSFRIKFILKSLSDDQKIPKSICKIINSVTSSNDILVGNLAGRIRSHTVNDIVQCIERRHAVVITNLNVDITNKAMKRASIMILLLNQLNQVNKEIMFWKTFEHQNLQIMAVLTSKSDV